MLMAVLSFFKALSAAGGHGAGVEHRLRPIRGALLRDVVAHIVEFPVFVRCTSFWHSCTNPDAAPRNGP